MATEIVEVDDAGQPPMIIEGPPAPALFAGRALAPHVSAGAVEIESQRAIAEAQGKLVIAQKFPRSVQAAANELQDACGRLSLAKSAFYSYKRGGETISGPSIRLAEEIVRCWGNIEYGLRELSHHEGASEMEAFAWDLQTNTISSQKFTVGHVRDTKGGGKKLTEQRDVYEITANMGARRLRARMLAVVPKWLVDEAVQRCKETIATGDGKPIAARRQAVTAAFAKFGVTAAQIAARIGRAVDQLTGDDLAELQGIYTGLKDGVTKAAEEFGGGDAAPAEDAASAILKQAATGATPATGAKAAAKPADAAHTATADGAGAAGGVAQEGAREPAEVF